MPKKQAALPGTVGPSSRSGERTPTQNFLEVLTEASAPQRMALKPQNDREMKGLEGSNPPFSANESGCRGNLRGTVRNSRLCARFERPTEPERDESRRHSTLCECFSPRGHRLVRF